MSKMKGKKIEYTREYKIRLWEKMIQDYFKRGMLTMNEIKKKLMNLSPVSTNLRLSSQT